MNALKSKLNLQKREQKERLKKEVEKIFDEINGNRVYEISQATAFLQGMHLIAVICDCLGLGKIRTGRIMAAIISESESFNKDLVDGVAWYKTKKRLEKRGLEFTKEENAMCLKAEKLHEKGVTRID